MRLAIIGTDGFGGQMLVPALHARGAELIVLEGAVFSSLKSNDGVTKAIVRLSKLL